MSLKSDLPIPKLNDLEKGICIDIGCIACVSCLYYYICNYKDKDNHKSSFERMKDGNVIRREDKPNM